VRLRNTWDVWLDLARRRGVALATVGWFVLANAALLVWLQPWAQLEWSTWFCGYEAGRIARNLQTGYGYGSPFFVFPGDNFSDTQPVEPQPPDWLPADTQRASGADPSRSTADPRVGQDGPRPTGWVTPPYVFLFWAVFACCGVYTPAAVAVGYLLQTLFMAAAVYLMWAVLLRSGERRAAALWLPLAVLYPPFWYFSIRDAHGTTLFILLAVASLYGFARLLEQDGGLRWAWAQAACAVLAVLAEPASILFFLALELGLIWWLMGRPLYPRRRLSTYPPPRNRRAAALGVALGVTAAVLLGPWWVRNAVVFQKFVPLKSNLAMELYYGNNLAAETDMVAAHFERLPTTSYPERRLLHQLGEPAFAGLCWARFAEYVRARPLVFIRLSLQRVIYFWSYNPFKKNVWRPALDILLHLALALGLFGCLLPGKPRCGWLNAACVGFLLLYPLAFYATHFLIYRYRLPLEAILLAWVALRADGLIRLLEARGKGAQAAAPAAGASSEPPAQIAKSTGTT